MPCLFARRAFLAEGWRRNVRVEIDAEGRIAAVTPETDAAPGDVDLGARFLAPAACNVHSHGFQRAMAGMTGLRSRDGDDFWDWRALMYRFVQALTPVQIEAITALAFMEMMEAGFAAVGEFHYLHNQPGGEPYSDIAEISRRIFAAAEATGIGLTHLPALYSCGGAGEIPLERAQMRFANEIDRFARLADACRKGLGALGADHRLGFAPHSLRATRPADLLILAREWEEAPIHIHAAEQEREVEEVQAWLGSRPVDYLVREIGIGRRWCLIHATHMNRQETCTLAASGAVAGLCPLTEADLGDGVFSGLDYVSAGGRYAIGTDANLAISFADELRQLEYSLRLVHRRRNLLSAAGSVGETLYRTALAGGAQAIGRESGAILPGLWADLVAFDGDNVDFAALEDRQLFDGWIFGGRAHRITDLWSAGRHRVQHGTHRCRETIEHAYRRAIADLVAAI